MCSHRPFARRRGSQSSARHTALHGAGDDGRELVPERLDNLVAHAGVDVHLGVRDEPAQFERAFNLQKAIGAAVNDRRRRRQLLQAGAPIYQSS